MKLIVIIFFLFIFSIDSYAQTAKVLDYRVKTTANATERTEMLDAFRTSLYKESGSLNLSLL